MRDDILPGLDVLPTAAPRARRRWTDQEMADLRSAYESGRPTGDIAFLLGRSKGAVWSKVSRLKIRRNGADSARLIETPSLPAPEALPRQPKPFVRTKLGGRQIVWFEEKVERMERLWLANVHHDTIAAVLSGDITGVGVQSKANRMKLPARHGAALIRDVGTARLIDEMGPPIPQKIRFCGKVLTRRFCAMSGVPFWSKDDRISFQAKETLAYRMASSMADGAVCH